MRDPFSCPDPPHGVVLQAIGIRRLGIFHGVSILWIYNLRFILYAMRPQPIMSEGNWPMKYLNFGNWDTS